MRTYTINERLPTEVGPWGCCRCGVEVAWSQSELDGLLDRDVVRAGKGAWLAHVHCAASALDDDSKRGAKRWNATAFRAVGIDLSNGVGPGYRGHVVAGAEDTRGARRPTASVPVTAPVPSVTAPVTVRRTAAGQIRTAPAPATVTAPATATATATATVRPPVATDGALTVPATVLTTLAGQPTAVVALAGATLPVEVVAAAGAGLGALPGLTVTLGGATYRRG